MTAAPPKNVISFKITKFPHSLIIPSEENIITFQAMNYLNKNETVKIQIQGENLEVIVPDELKEEVQFGPGETKDFDVKINPVADGFGKITIGIYWMQMVEYTVKVQKVREKVATSKVFEYFGKRELVASHSVDMFNPYDFMETMTVDDVKKAEEELYLKKSKYQSFQLLKSSQARLTPSVPSPSASSTPGSSFESSLDALDSALSESVPEVTLPEIDDDIKKLAKGYLSNKNLEKALELANEITDETERQEFYYNLIRAHNSIDLEGNLRVISKLRKTKKKQELIKKLAIDRVRIDPEQSGRIALLIEDVAVKENLMKDIIAKTIESDPGKALKLSYLIDDPDIKIIVLFNIAKKFHELNNAAESTEILQQVIELCLNTNKVNISENNYNNKYYVDLMDALRSMAEIDCPKNANAIIEGLHVQELKDKIGKELFDLLYEMGDDINTKMELTPIFSQYFLFNTYISNLNNSVKDFSLIGGNVSNNLLTNDFNFNVAFVSLFNFDFQIFPVIDRVYTDLRINLKKSIAYYIYPSIDKHKTSEMKVINDTLNQFLISKMASIPSQLIVFNLDFIPYVGKPTIIIAPEPELVDYFSSRIKKAVGDAANLVFDDSLFKGGKSLDNLKSLFPPNKCRVVNLILSYEFINNYEVLKAFVQSLL